MDRQWWLHFRPYQSPVIYNPLCPLRRESTSSSANISGLIQFGAALWRGVVVMVVVVGPCCVGCGFLLSPGWSSDHHSCVTHCHTCQVSSSEPRNYAERRQTRAPYCSSSQSDLHTLCSQGDATHFCCHHMTLTPITIKHLTHKWHPARARLIFFFNP